MSTPDVSRATWRTSSHSGANGNCVSAAILYNMSLDDVGDIDVSDKEA